MSSTADMTPGELRLEATSGHSGRPASVLDAPVVTSRRVHVLAAVGTTALHAAIVALAFYAGIRGLQTKRGPDAPVTQMVEVVLPPPTAPEPPPAEEKPPEPATPAPPPPAAPKIRAPKAAPTPKEAPPPAAAQAGKILEAAPEVVDFGEQFVSGTANSYAGGVTERGGTATHAVRDARARAGGVEGGTGTNLQGDLSREPQLAGGAEWDCPFPPEADAADIDHATVTLRVSVAASGTVESVQATKDPGNGFGREARRCAQSKRWSPARDRAGTSISKVALINVSFDR
ncbi:MAG: energy transducer TonB [Polyangiales bacterium]